MEEIRNDSVQNRFTAYLIVAVTNKRIWYFTQRKRIQTQECLETDLQEKKYTDFETLYQAYMVEKSAILYQERVSFQEMMKYIESQKLVKTLERLKEYEVQILFARSFKEQNFSDLGAELHMEPKQVETVYYYIIRKLRKELEGWKNEF